ncbi:HNH endonuclease [Rhodobacteraceae bacterium R_SAG2]|nr:HNH endonuclease [Rhodobacteraceae bacterium R_SAG2]
MSVKPVRNLFAQPKMAGKLNLSEVERKVFSRDGGRCQYCGCSHSITFDHVIPRSKGGASIESNIVCACRSCNSSKGAKELDEFKEWLQAERVAFEMHLACEDGL